MNKSNIFSKVDLLSSLGSKREKRKPFIVMVNYNNPATVKFVEGDRGKVVYYTEGDPPWVTFHEERGCGN
jgi:hypothetical protein